MSIGYGNGNMEQSICSTYVNHFDVLLIGHAAHVYSDKVEAVSLCKIACEE